MWCFPNGVRIVSTKDQKFAKIEDYFHSDEEKLATIVSEMNYYVINNIVNMTKTYVTSALFYEKIYIMDNINQNPQKLIELWIPKSYAISSSIPIFSVQRSLMLHLLLVHKMKQNNKKDHLIHTQKNQTQYSIEESKLCDFYMKTALQICLIQEQDVHYSVKLNSKDIWFSYYIKNNVDLPMSKILCPGNNAFETVIFNQSPYNILKLLLFAMHEYQIIFLAKRAGYVTFFCENLFDLLQPLQWKGIYIPFLMENQFDYENTNIPYIIGLDRSTYKVPKKIPSEVKKRVVYDLEDNTFLLFTSEPQIPKHYQCFIISKMNEVISELKFWEEDYQEESVLKYKQHIYNFNLLMFHDLLHYFSQPQPQTQPQSKKKVAYFNYKAYLENFPTEYREFFAILTKTQIFQHFIKECFKAEDYKEEYINSMKKKQHEFNFLVIFQFIKDVKFLAHRTNKEESLEKKLSLLEEQQNILIQQILGKKIFHPESKQVLDYLPDYLQNNITFDNFDKKQSVIFSQTDSEFQPNSKKQTNDQSFDSTSIISNPLQEDYNRHQMRHLEVHKNVMFIRNQDENLNKENLEEKQENSSMRQQQISSDRISIDLQSTISNNIGRYLPRKSGYSSTQNGLKSLSQKSINNKSLLSMYPIIGESEGEAGEGEVEYLQYEDITKPGTARTSNLIQNILN